MFLVFSAESEVRVMMEYTVDSILTTRSCTSIFIVSFGQLRIFFGIVTDEDFLNDCFQYVRDSLIEP